MGVYTQLARRKMLLILSVCLGLGAAAPQLTSEDYYQEYEYYEYVVDDALPRKSDPAFIEVQEINQEQLDKTPIFIGETTVKKKVPLVCVSCRSQGITRRPQQPIDNVIKGTQDEFGEDGRNKVKATPQNTRRAQVPLNHALKSAQDALGEDGRDQVAIQPTRQLTKIDPRRRLSAIEAVRASKQGAKPTEGKVQVTSKPRTRTRIQVGRTKSSVRKVQESIDEEGKVNTQAASSETRLRPNPRTRVRMRDAAKLRRQKEEVKEEDYEAVEEQS